MKRSNLIGIDIGNYRLKVAHTKNGIVQNFFAVPLPENLVKGDMVQYWEPMAGFLRESLKGHGIRTKNAVFSVPLSALYVRTVELPLMTIKQLEINLPFEFHDYISNTSDDYYYDYAVIEKTETTMKLLAVACAKSLIQKYKILAKQAHLRIVGLLPNVIGFQRIIQRYDQLYNLQGKKDFAILDMGDHSFAIHFFHHGVYEITRSLEPGASQIISLLSENTGKERHVVRMEVEKNNATYLEDPRLSTYYENRAVEIMRVLNFYSYSNTGNTIDTLYYCGGGAFNEKQLSVIANTLTLPMRPLTDLMEYNQNAEILAETLVSPLTFGLALDPEQETGKIAEEPPHYEGIHFEEDSESAVLADGSIDLSKIRIDDTPDPMAMMRYQDSNGTLPSDPSMTTEQAEEAMQ